MKGKEKCKALKELRRKIAEENDIAFAVSECTHQGECKGTCPKCESELRYLERELERRTKLGKTVALAGLSVCLAGVVAGCDSKEKKKPWGESNNGLFTTTTEEDIEGDVGYNPDDIEGEIDGDINGDIGPVDYDTTESGTILK